MNNREPSWWHMLWIIPSVIIVEALMVLGLMEERANMDGDDKV